MNSHGCETAVDYGCGEGSWIKSLLLDAAESRVSAIAGVDESPTALRRGCKRVLAALVKRPLQEPPTTQPPPAIQLLQVGPPLAELAAHASMPCMRCGTSRASHGGMGADT